MGDVNRFFSKKNLNPLAKWALWKENHTSKNTVNYYQHGINKFLEHNKISDLNELYEIYLESLERGKDDPLARYVVQDLIRDTVNNMIKRGYAGSHAKAVKSGITKFFRVLGFEDFKVTLKRGFTKQNSNGGSNIITPEGLAKVVNLSDDLQKKALLLTLKDSGLRLGDALNLTIGDLEEALSTNMDFFYLSKLTEKTDSRAQTVIGFESLNALRDWYKYRKQQNEPLTKDSPIFRPYKLRDENPNNKAHKDPEKNIKIKSEMRLNPKSASTTLSRLFRKAGYPDVTAHSLRKYHSTYLALGENRLSEPMIVRLEGRNIGDSREFYKIYPAEEVVSAYKANYHMIQITPTESKTVQQLREENLELRKLLEEETRKRESLLGDLMTRLEKLEQKKEN
jgi:integrase